MVLVLTTSTCATTGPSATSMALFYIAFIVISVVEIQCFTPLTSISLRPPFVSQGIRKEFSNGIQQSRSTTFSTWALRSTNENDSSSNNNGDIYTSTGAEGNVNENDSVEEPLKTISGGPSEIFTMARRMMIWNEEYGYSSQNSLSSSPSSTTTPSPSSSSSSSPKIRALPRWHPHEGIADNNPSFRNRPPAMNNKGYAMLIRRNSRKRNKQSLWRHAYRTYETMKQLELDQRREIENNGGVLSSSKMVIRRHVVHFEAALVSCSKLGLWREALSIYDDVLSVVEEQRVVQQQIAKRESLGGGMSNSNSVGYVFVKTSDATTTSTVRRKVPRIIVTDNMILSIVAACVRGSKRKNIISSDIGTVNSKGNSNTKNNKNNTDKEEERKIRREPLDAARNILLSMEEQHNILLVSRHINPLAAAYQHIGLYNEGSELIRNTLADRKTQAQDKEEETAASFNINDLQSKDSASYNILIQGAIMEGDWASAIGSLRDMTEKGLYPESRSLGVWSETSMKRERRGGSRKTTWMKNRERLITGNLPVSRDQRQV